MWILKVDNPRLSCFAGTALTKCHGLGCLNNRNVLSLNYECCENHSAHYGRLRSRWQQAYLPLRSLLGWQKPAFLPCPYTVFCLCVSILGVSESQFLLLVKTSIILDEGPSQQSHFNLITQSPISKYSHIMRYWELTFQQMNWGVCGGGWVGDGIQSVTQSKRISISGLLQERLSVTSPIRRKHGWLSKV